MEVGAWGRGTHVDGLVVALQLAAVALHELRSKVLVRATDRAHELALLVRVRVRVRARLRVRVRVRSRVRVRVRVSMSLRSSK